MRVLIAPDSFKGSATAVQTARALAAGWYSVRPDDELLLCPQADGGEGTAEVLQLACGGQRMRLATTGPTDQVVYPWWLLLPDGTAVVELALASGLPLLDRPDPLGAHTVGFGQLLAAACADRRVRKVLATLGGSASTDGGTGALTALGAIFTDSSGQPVPPGGGAVAEITAVDITGLRPPPPGGVLVLTDVTAPLCGPTGAAAVFGPQKGASAAQIGVLDAALAQLCQLLGGEPQTPGAGAAGGTGYGLATCWGAHLVGGANVVATWTGLPAAIAHSDLVVTGEGRLDATSLTGKVVGHLVAQAAPRPVLVAAGQVDQPLPPGIAQAVACADLAGSIAAAQVAPLRWIETAGAELARQV